MKRVLVKPRDGWQEKVEEKGLTYHSGGKPPSEQPGVWWYEGAYYELTSDEVDTLEAVTEELYGMCLQTVDYILQPINDGDFTRTDNMGIPRDWAKLAWETWNRDNPQDPQTHDPSLYGRFDLAWNDGVPKLLEFNADTPTTLIESAVTQWYWLEEMFPDADQFNSIWPKLEERFAHIRSIIGDTTFYFAALRDHEEEVMTVETMRDAASQAGLNTKFIAMEDLGWDETHGVMTDLDENQIQFMFKLYPWEWLWDAPFGDKLFNMGYDEDVGIIEPAWKMILSNKGFMVYLWKLFPNHPNLLVTEFESPDAVYDKNWISKPILGREGANVTNGDQSTVGPYVGKRVVQHRAKLFNQGGINSVIGSWVVADKAAGVIFRESEDEIITGDSRVVPHIFK